LFNRKRDGTALNARKLTGVAMAIVPPVEPSNQNLDAAEFALLRGEPVSLARLSPEDSAAV
jgi:hypothetical protein